MPARTLPSDDALQQLLTTDVGKGWRVFVESYTPMLVGLIERAGVRDRDEAMEVYTLICERLTADGCARLRRRDPAKGHMGSWLAVVVRHTVVDWVRQRAGRRRLFGAIEQLDAFHQQVFEQYFWEERSLAEIAEELGVRHKERIPLDRVLAAIDTIHGVLTPRHRSELLSTAMRTRPMASLDADVDDAFVEPIDARPTADEMVSAKETRQAFERALAGLPREDAAIIRLRYVQALSLPDVRRALHLSSLTESRVRAILDRLRDELAPHFEPRHSTLRSVSPHGGSR